MRAFRLSAKTLFLLAILAALLVGVWKYNALADWIKLRGYDPPADIMRIADVDTMTAYARHIYYVNHPRLVTSGSQFKQDCPQIEQTIVLGCYQSGEDGIFLRDVSDPRLNGVEEVTAAHEMLHGVYDRLSGKDKSSVDGLLMDYYNSGLSDQRVKDTIEAYKKSEPNDVVNEMHSVFGTEIAHLPQPLETYYARYFTNRTVVTGLAAGYQAEFTSRIDQIKAYEDQLSVLKQQIDYENATLDKQQSQLEADRNSLDSLRSSGSISQYNAQVPIFNLEVSRYNNGVNRLKDDIETYNRVVGQHNELAAELRGLYTSLGTDLATQPAQ